MPVWEGTGAEDKLDREEGVGGKLNGEEPDTVGEALLESSEEVDGLGGSVSLELEAGVSVEAEGTANDEVAVAEEEAEADAEAVVMVNSGPLFPESPNTEAQVNTQYQKICKENTYGQGSTCQRVRWGILH
jgi:hypothetical protein